MIIVVFVYSKNLLACVRDLTMHNSHPLLLQMSETNKPKKCATEFTALMNAYNGIVDEYKGLPAKLKEDGVERVKLSFEETDIGSTDLKDSKSTCGFAKKLVGRLKKAEDYHKKRLGLARGLVCTKTGSLLKNKLASKLLNCLGKSKQEADKVAQSLSKMPQ